MEPLLEFLHTGRTIEVFGMRQIRFSVLLVTGSARAHVER